MKATLKLKLSIIFFVLALLGLYFTSRIDYHSNYKSFVTPTPSPAPSNNGYWGYSSEYPSNVKKVTFVKETSIYYRDILSGNRMSPEKLLLTSEKSINFYNLFKDGYLILTTIDITEDQDHPMMSGKSKSISLIDLDNNKTTTIFTSTGNSTIRYAEYSKKDNSIFISTDYDGIYSYSLDNHKVTNLIPENKSKNLEESFCAGNAIIDRSPDGKHYILAGLCFEGVSYTLYSVETNRYLDLGHEYGGGKRVIGFMDNGAIEIVETDGPGDIVSRGNYNYQSQLVQELPLSPTPTPDHSPRFVRLVNTYTDTDYKQHEDYYLVLQNSDLDPKDSYDKNSLKDNFIGQDIEKVEVY